MPITNWRNLQHGDLCKLKMDNENPVWVKVVDVLNSSILYRVTDEEEIRKAPIGYFIDNATDAF